MYDKQDYKLAYRYLRLSRGERLSASTRDEIEQMLRSRFSLRILRAIAYTWNNRG